MTASSRESKPNLDPKSPKPRCGWVPVDDELYVAYHDLEWGIPTHDDRHLFEMITLEGAQAGLSWRTILGRRQGYQAAFAGFDPSVVARYDERNVEALVLDAGIVRHRGKIESTINPDHSRDVWLVGVDEWFGLWCGVGWLIGVCRGSGGAGGLVRGA